jgi:hypothetical protein
MQTGHTDRARKVTQYWQEIYLQVLRIILQNCFILLCFPRAVEQLEQY